MLIWIVLLCFWLHLCSAQNCSHKIGVWRNKLEIPQFHIEGPFIAANNKLYVFTGFQTNDLVCKNTMEVFDPQNNSWTSLATTPVNVSHVQSVFDGKYGQFSKSDNLLTILDTSGLSVVTKEYLPTTNHSLQHSSMMSAMTCGSKDQHYPKLGKYFNSLY